MNNLDELKRSIKLLDLISTPLRPSGRYHIGPCPFCGGRDRFNIKHTDQGDVWLCRHCAPERYQDVIAFVMRHEQLSFVEAVKALGGNLALTMTPPNKAKHLTLDNGPSESWQLAACTAVMQAAEKLYSKPAKNVLAYLQEQRGLTLETIEHAKLGYNPSWSEVAPKLWLAAGVTIPAFMQGGLWYVQVRTTKAARLNAQEKGGHLDKYHALKGSKLKSLYLADRLLEAHTAIVTEGEFDALLLNQFLPRGVAAVTMGSAKTLPTVAWLKYFAAVKRVFLVMDNDPAGQASLQSWGQILGWAGLLPLPQGFKDITDFWRFKGDITGWLSKKLV